MMNLARFIISIFIIKQSFVGCFGIDFSTSDWLIFLIDFPRNIAIASIVVFYIYFVFLATLTLYYLPAAWCNGFTINFLVYFKV